MITADIIPENINLSNLPILGDLSCHFMSLENNAWILKEKTDSGNDIFIPLPLSEFKNESDYILYLRLLINVRLAAIHEDHVKWVNHMVNMANSLKTP